MLVGLVALRRLPPVVAIRSWGIGAPIRSAQVVAVPAA